MKNLTYINNRIKLTLITEITLFMIILLIFYNFT